MKMIWNKFVWIALVLAVAAVWLDYKATTYPLVSKSISITQSGQTVTKDVIEVPMGTRVLNLIALALYGLATSIFISVLVTDRIEAKRHTEHQKELDSLNAAINVNVFDSLFKTIMPPEVYAAIKNDIILCKLVRRNFTWIYDFTYDGAFVCLKQTLKYQLLNSSANDINDPIVARTEPDPKSVPDADVLERVSCVIDNKQIVAFERGKKTEGVTERTANDGMKETVINFVVPTRKEADVTIVWRQKYRNCEKCWPIRDAYFTQYPIINGELIVNKPREMTFTLFQSMATELRLTSEEPDRLMYKAEGAILPRQGFVYIVCPNKTPDGIRQPADGSSKPSV